MFDSDHTLLLFSICLHIKHKRPARRYAYDNKKANFKAINSELEKRCLCDILTAVGNVNDTCEI